jgi:hypothetical protein
MNSEQGIGITIFGAVIDRKGLGRLALTISGGLITLVTALLAFSEASISSAGNSICALSAGQASALSAVIKTFDLNSSCAYNQTIDFVALKADDNEARHGGAIVFNRRGSTPMCWNHTSYNASVITCPCGDNTSSLEYGGVAAALKSDDVWKGGGACGTIEDCMGGGDCKDGKCVCDAMFTGANCIQLDLLPVDPEHAGWPQPPATTLPTEASFPWGGALAQDDAGLYHLFATEWMNQCPMRYDTFTTSTQIIHLSSSSAVGPWKRLGVAVPNAAGNPAYTRAPDGTHLLYFTCQRWTGAAPQNCTSKDMRSWGHPTVNPEEHNCSKTLGISLAYSTDLTSWKYQYNVISVPASNPGGPVFLKSGMLMPFQTWPPGAPCTKPSCITYVTAESWRDWPYNTYPLGEPGKSRRNCIEQQNVSNPGSVEDPSNIWRDERGTLHVLMHEATFGSRAWSRDGLSWSYAYQNRAYPYCLSPVGELKWPSRFPQ